MRGHRFETSDLAVEPLEDVGIHLVLVELVEHLVAAVLVELELHVLAASFQEALVDLLDRLAVVADGSPSPAMK